MTNCKRLNFFGSAVLILLLAAGTANGQSATEAYRYSSTGQVGTARNIAVGGVMGGLGADFSVLSTNPAGLARYKSTEFGITANFAFGNTAGSYLDNRYTEDHFAFNISHAGAVFALRQSQSDGWRGITLGVGLNRLDHYNDNFTLAGTNTNSSLLDQHAFIANGTEPDAMATTFPFDAGLTYLGYLINPDSSWNYSTVYQGVAPDQQVYVERRGGKYEIATAFSGNYNDRLYVGGAIGIPIIRFDERSLIAEQDADNNVDGYNFFDFNSRVRTNGYGVNFKAGFLAKVHDLVRFGAAFQTPTYLRMDDAYYTGLYADFDSVYYEIQSPDGVFTYNMVLPWKLLANAAVLLDRYGFIAVEYELQDPSGASLKFKSSNTGLNSEEQVRNDDIDDSFEWQHNVKAGIEVKLNPIRLRAGFQLKTSGIQGNTDNTMVYSGGLGYRGKHFFVDGTYSFTSFMSEYTPYEVANITSGVAGLSHKRSQVLITVGMKL